MKKQNHYVGFVICLILFGGCYKCMYDEGINIEKEDRRKAESATPAQQLASLDAGVYVEIDDYRTVEIQNHLTSLSGVFSEPEKIIANSTYKAKQMMAERGLSYTNIQLLRLADKDLDIYKNSGIKYEEFMAAVTTLTNR